MWDKEKHERASKGKNAVKAGGPGGIWFMGFVGALVYNMHVHSGTFWLVVLAFLKALFWPAYLVYHVFLLLRI